MAVITPNGSVDYVCNTGWFDLYKTNTVQKANNIGSCISIT